MHMASVSSPPLSKKLAVQLLRIALITTPLTALFLLTLAYTDYLDAGAHPGSFGPTLVGYAIGVQPWFLAAPIVVLAGFYQAKERQSLLVVAFEALLLASAVAGLHLLNLTFFLAPHFGMTIHELLPSLGIRDWFWDIMLFILTILSGHLLCMVPRRNEQGGPKPNDNKIMARSASRVDIVDIGDVIAASAQGNYVALITEQSEFLHRATISEMKKQLVHHGFVQVHRSHLVRIDSIASVIRADGRIKDIHLHGGREFPVSAGNQEQLKTMLRTGHITV